MMTSLGRPIRRHLRELLVRSLDPRQRRRLTWQLMAATGVRLISFERHGLTWNVRTDDDIGWSLFVDGGFQAAQMQALVAWIGRYGLLSSSRNVVVDCGANIGSSCIPIAKQTGCRVLAIEPTVENLARLRQNVESNGLDEQIRIANKAVANRAGSVRMCLLQGHGGHFVDRGSGAGLSEQAIVGYEDVEADTLAGIVEAAGMGADEIALVWADVQGCERDVIESGSTFWARGVPLWAEVEPRSLLRQGTLEVFADAVAAHFDRFIDARELMRIGASAVPLPIREFRQLVQGITPEQINTDVLLLPPAWQAHR